MDRVGLRTLRDEMRDDDRIIQDAYRKAAMRLARKEEIAYEACAHQLCRLYNAFEQASLRLAKAFENHIDDEQGWHAVLLDRVSIAIEGVRPALIPLELKNPLHELRGFRHVFVHAYDLDLDPDKLALLLKYANQVAARLPALIDGFVASVERALPSAGG